MDKLFIRLYRGVATSAGPLIQLWLARRRARGKEHPKRWAERLGQASQPRPKGPLMWLHAASVGEAMSVLSLVTRLRDERPGLSILVTTGTLTSAQLMTERLPDGAVHQFAPADRPSWVRRFLDHWRPDLAIWVESEFWPVLLTETRARGIRTLLVNGRMSDDSARGWERWRPVIARLLGGFELCLVQDAGQVERFRELGAPDPECLGNLKAAGALLPVDAAAQKDLQTKIGDRPFWLAASTHPGEEEVVAEAHRKLASRHPGLLTILVPRHPARSDEVAALLADLGLRCVRRSKDEAIADDTQVYLADTLGELGLFYALSDIAFVGGSIAEAGGHNPIEAVQLDCAVVTGPDQRNCVGVASDLIAVGGVRQVHTASELALEVDRLLSDAATCARQRKAARRVWERNADALDRVMEALAPWLDPLAPRVENDEPAAAHARA